jgi:hypothetical protein
MRRQEGDGRREATRAGSKAGRTRAPIPFPLVEPTPEPFLEGKPHCDHGPHLFATAELVVLRTKDGQVLRRLHATPGGFVPAGGDVCVSRQ